MKGRIKTYSILVLSALILIGGASAQDSRLYDSFEDQNYNTSPAWQEVDGTNLQISSAEAWEGTYSLKFGQNSEINISQHTLEDGQNYTVYFYPESTPSDNTADQSLSVQVSSQTGFFRFEVRASGTDQWSTRYNGDDTTDTTGPLQGDDSDWYRVDMKVIDGGNEQGIYFYNSTGHLLDSRETDYATGSQFSELSIEGGSDSGTSVYVDQVAYDYSNYLALNQILPENNTYYVEDDTGTVNIDFLFEWITQQSGVSNTDFDLTWTVWNRSDDSIALRKNYDLGTGPSSGSINESEDIPSGNYFWSLQGKAGNDIDLTSDNRTFTVFTQAQSPFDITLLEPEDGAVLDSEGDFTEVDFKFNIDADQTGTWSLETDQLNGSLVQGNIPVGDNNISTSYDLESNTFYTWRINADNNSLIISSETFDFTIGEYDTDTGTDNLFAQVLEPIINTLGEFNDAITGEIDDGGLLLIGVIISGLTAGLFHIWLETSIISEIIFFGMLITFWTWGYVANWIMFLIVIIGVLLVSATIRRHWTGEGDR